MHQQQKFSLLRVLSGCALLTYFCLLYASFTPQTRSRENAIPPINEAIKDATTPRNVTNPIWISLSVCLGGPKSSDSFPYALAAQLSARLWVIKTDANVVIQAVTVDSDRGREELDALKTSLADLDRVKVVALDYDGGLGSCALHAQLQRMFAFKLDFIR